MKTTIKLPYLPLLFLVLLFFTFCTREDALVSSITNENSDEKGLSLTFNGTFSLPVNLTEYDHASGVRTKNTNGDAVIHT